MKKADKVKLFYIVSISLLFILSSCVDTGVQVIPSSLDFNSQVKIVNLAPTTGSASIKLLKSVANDDGSYSVKSLQDISGLAVGDEYPSAGQDFMEVNSGYFYLLVNGNSDSLKVKLETDRKERLFLLEDTSKTVFLTPKILRYTWQTKDSEQDTALYPANMTSISFLNGAPDVAIDGIGISSSSTDTTISVSLAQGDAFGYTKFKAPASFTITFMSGEDTLSTATVNAQAKGRYSAVIFGSKSSNSLQTKVFTDD